MGRCANRMRPSTLWKSFLALLTSSFLSACGGVSPSKLPAASVSTSLSQWDFTVLCKMEGNQNNFKNEKISLSEFRFAVRGKVNRDRVVLADSSDLVTASHPFQWKRLQLPTDEGLPTFEWTASGAAHSLSMAAQVVPARESEGDPLRNRILISTPNLSLENIAALLKTAGAVGFLDFASEPPTVYSSWGRPLRLGTLHLEDTVSSQYHYPESRHNGVSYQWNLKCRYLNYFL